MKRTVGAIWIIGSILLIGTATFAEGINPRPSIQFPDPALIGKPVNPQSVGAFVQYTVSDYVSFIDKLEAMPEKKIDIGMVALAVAKDVYPDIDTKAYSRRINKMVEAIKKITNGSKDPDWRIRVMNSYLYRNRGIHYANDDPCAEKKENRYITGILDYKKGCCVSMPTFYMAVGQRLGYPIYPVSAPQHVFIRYVDPKFKEQNIEATGGGGYTPDGEYKEVLRVSAKAIKSGAYLRTLSYREFLGDLICQNGNYWLSEGEVDRAVYYLAAARRMYPKSADICQAFGNALLAQSSQMNGRGSIQVENTGRECLRVAEDMGVEHLPRENYLEEQKKAQKKYRSKHKLQGATQ